MPCVGRGCEKAWPDRCTEGVPSHQFPAYGPASHCLIVSPVPRARTACGGRGPGAHGGLETLRRELRAWTCNDADRNCATPSPHCGRQRPPAPKHNGAQTHSGLPRGFRSRHFECSPSGLATVRGGLCGAGRLALAAARRPGLRWRVPAYRSGVWRPLPEGRRLRPDGTFRPRAHRRAPVGGRGCVRGAAGAACASPGLPSPAGPPSPEVPWALRERRTVPQNTASQWPWRPHVETPPMPRSVVVASRRNACGCARRLSHRGRPAPEHHSPTGPAIRFRPQNVSKP